MRSLAALLLFAASVAQAAPPGMSRSPVGRTVPPGSQAPAPSSTPAAASVPSATLSTGSAASSTLSPAPAPSATIPAGPAPTSTVMGQAAPASTVMAEAAPLTRTQAGEPQRTLRLPTEDEMHKRTYLVMLPSAFAANYRGATGANLNVFMGWYIGTFYNEKGLFIAPLFTLLIGADGKWAFLGESRAFPGVAAGYFTGLALPFTGGGVKASGVSQNKQTDVHNVYGVMSKRVGPLSFSAGAMYGIKRALPRVVPMLRNASYTTKTIPRSESLWTAFGGVDASYREQHLKVEVLTIPEDLPEVRPWLVQTHIDGFLGFDIAYMKDAVGYEVLGYYLLPFFRWPDKRDFEKQRERLIADMEREK